MFDEIQRHKENEIELFKQSLNKTKPHFKNMDNVHVIAEVDSKDEVSTQFEKKSELKPEPPKSKASSKISSKSKSSKQSK